MSKLPCELKHPLPLEGGMLWVGGIVLALANFVAVLNMTIANVTVPNIAGALGRRLEPGHLGDYLLRGRRGHHGSADRMAVRALRRGAAVLHLGGAVRGLLAALRHVDLPRNAARHACVAGYGGWAAAGALPDAVAAHLPEGAVHAGHGALGDDDTARARGRPGARRMAVRQLLLAVGFLDQRAHGISLRCRSRGSLLKRYQDPAVVKPVDKIGMLLLVIWVAALQIMLDEGKDKDWFSSTEIRVLAITAVIGFISFLIWELTEKNPIVDLRVFRHRGFSSCMLVLALAFGAFFGLNVLTPQWLQYNMGYTTTWAGLVVAWGGLLSVVFSPIAAKLANRVDPRILIFIGCLWLGLDTFWRAYATSDMSYWVICIPLFFMGVGMPMYYVPLTGLAMGSVKEEETASAAGLMNFVRTISGAIATSLVTTSWQNRSIIAHAELANVVDPTGQFAATLAPGDERTDRCARCSTTS